MQANGHDHEVLHATDGSRTTAGVTAPDRTGHASVPATTHHGGRPDLAAHDHAGGHQGHDKHAGHDPEAFRRKFWLSLILTVPIVVTSHMVMDWFGYSVDFPGMSWVGPVLGTAVFCYGGWPFLAGAVREIRDRAPGMMLLISMAITVAYVASLLTSLGVFDLDFWWELAALVTIMLLGHWQEMKAIGQAQGALAALAALLPDDADRITADGTTERVPVARLAVGDTVLVRPGAGRRPDRRRQCEAVGGPQRPAAAPAAARPPRAVTAGGSQSGRNSGNGRKAVFGN